MPLHDWTRVRPGMFHHFHNAWIYRLADSLNDGLLPPGFFAAGEQIAGRLEPDVVAFATESAEDLEPVRGGGVLAVAEHPPLAAIHEESETLHALRRADRLVIRRVGDDRLVAVVEIVSPGNKTSRSRLQDLVDKVCELVEGGTHVVVIDLFPPGRLAPEGLHVAFWDALAGEPAQGISAGERLTAAYCAGKTTSAYVQPVRVGESLPAPPLFLDETAYLPLPLEETYESVWKTYPAPWRTIVESTSP